jgi:NADH:ubiquinone oxidoreductase subunit 5 (chain L)/Multisubunit Na+/H+ antiporter, MnhA subunit
LAYSTISHCGFLFVSLGLGVTSLTLIYLLLHGIFKAATFFSVGSVSRLYKTQDIRQTGSLSVISPVDSLLLIFYTINLAGFPCTFGYLYKSLFTSFVWSNLHQFYLVGLLIVALPLSVLYSFRLIYYIVGDYLKLMSFSSLIDIKLKLKPNILYSTTSITLICI